MPQRLLGSSEGIAGSDERGWVHLLLRQQLDRASQIPAARPDDFELVYHHWREIEPERLERYELMFAWRRPAPASRPSGGER